MTVDELIEKLKEFDGSLDVQSVSYADTGGSCGCCSYLDFEYDDATEPYLAKATFMERVPRKKPKTGYDYRQKQHDVVRIDAR